LQVIAFLDRVHGYLPGWEIPKLGPGSLAKDYGFITDYFCEIMHELRRRDVLSGLRSRFKLFDARKTALGVSGRDQRAVLKTTSGLLKLLHPPGQVNDQDLEEVVGLACELRQPVRDQLHLMSPGEYDKVKLAIRMTSTGKILIPALRDAGRVQRVTLPDQPQVGEVIGLAVSGDHGCILHFEMQATKGHGRIVPLGSIQRVMRESIEAAAQYIKAKHSDLGITQEWRENFDVAVLATFMGVPKEGPSAGITIATGIVSALTGRPVRNDLAITGEITIMGKVLPADNLKDTQDLPQYIRDAVKLTTVSTIDDVLKNALLPPQPTPHNPPPLSETA
jgi:ATP-dependent Lon protease